MGALALQLLQGRVEVLAPAFDRTQEGRKGQPADIGFIGALAFAGDIVFEIGELAFQISLHAIKCGHAALEFVDAEASETEQCVAAFHDTLPFPVFASWRVCMIVSSAA